MRTFTLMLIPDDSAGNMRRYRISRASLLAVFLAGAFFVMIVGFLTFDYLDLHLKTRDYDRIVAESEGLRGEARILEANLREVRDSLQHVEEYTKKLNDMTALSVKKVTKKSGVATPAGEKDSAATKGARVLTIAGLPIGLSMDKLAFRSTLEAAAELKQEAVLKSDELKSLITSLSQRQSILDSVPTVNPVDGWIASNFGSRTSPFTGHRGMHHGIDVAAPKGTPIVAPADGVVVFAGWKSGYGKFFMIAHGYGIVTRYGHCDEVLVKAGQRVTRGDKLATVGMSGRSTGPHLHYEVVVNGNTVNPRRFILPGERQLYSLAHQ